MNHLIVFLFVIAISFRLNGACPSNRVVIHNQVGPGIPLQYNCYGKNGKQTLKSGVRYIRTSSHTITFTDDYYKKGSTYARTIITCNLRYGPANENYFEGLKVYKSLLSPSGGSCYSVINQVFAKIGGIYFKKNSEPMVGPLKWLKT